MVACYTMTSALCLTRPAEGSWKAASIPGIYPGLSNLSRTETKNPFPFGLQATGLLVLEGEATKCFFLKFVPVLINVHYSKRILYGGFPPRDRNPLREANFNRHDHT